MRMWIKHLAAAAMVCGIVWWHGFGAAAEEAPAPATVSGTVVDDAGKPISAATVTVQRRVGGASQILARTETDEKGRFTVNVTPVGEVSLVAWSRDLFYSGPITVRAGETNTLGKITLKPRQKTNDTGIR